MPQENQFKMIDQETPSKKIQIEKIVSYDDSPDVSYFDNEDLQNYKAGNFFFVGVQAETTIYIPAWNNSYIIQKITSPGIWGIIVESFEDPYINEVYQEQKAILINMLNYLKTLDLNQIVDLD